MNNKIASYLGFAIKSRNIVFGYDNLCACKKNKVLVIYDDTLSEKVQEKLLRLVKFHSWQVIKLDYTIESVINRNCKALGVLDEHLSDAIKQNYKGEN